jgi:hypothetical protein
MDYGGFEQRCPPRSHDEHKRIMLDIEKHSKTKTSRAALESKHGVRYTVLVMLEYIDLITFTVVDPMHNFFLGTSKYFYKKILCDMLSDDDLNKIQTIVDGTKLPSYMANIPYKISSSFSSLTANQWAVWCNYLSMACLYGRVTEKVYRVWQLYVESCHLFCQPVISVHDLNIAHEKLMQFCRQFEKLFSSKLVTMNIHLHTHMVESIISHGPMPAFWLYGFERKNGLLGKFPTNNRSCEVQFMRSYLKLQLSSKVYVPQTFSTVLGPLLPMRKQSLLEHGQLVSTPFLLELQALSKGPVRVGKLWLNLDAIKFIGKGYNGYIGNTFRMYMKTSLMIILGEFDDSLLVGTFKKYFAIKYLGEKYGSFNSRLDRSSLILGSWCGIDSNVDTCGEKVRPGEVQYYMKVNISVDGIMKEIVLAHVRWFQRHYAEKMLKSTCCSVWCKDLFEPMGANSFIPIQRIQGKFVSNYITVKNEVVRVVTPMISHVYF